MIRINIEAHPGEGKYQTLNQIVQGLSIDGSRCHLFIWDDHACLKGMRLFDANAVTVEHTDFSNCFTTDGIDEEQLTEKIDALCPWDVSRSIVVFSAEFAHCQGRETELFDAIERYCDATWERSAYDPVHLICPTTTEDQQ